MDIIVSLVKVYTHWVLSSYTCLIVCSLLVTSMMWTFHLHDNQQHDADY